jgi:hypothetical protein
MSDVKRMIWVTFDKEGIHKYPQALSDPKLIDVHFLGHPHRHIFKFNVSIEVFHDDRDIEFILFKRELLNLYNKGTLQLDYKSCEMLAIDIIDYCKDKYPGRDISVTVSEDGENGATVTYTK